MICPQCKQGFLLSDCFSPIEPVMLYYRGYAMVITTQVYLTCSSCSYAVLEPLKDIDLDSEMVEFKRCINRKISLEELA